MRDSVGLRTGQRDATVTPSRVVGTRRTWPVLTAESCRLLSWTIASAVWAVVRPGIGWLRAIDQSVSPCSTLTRAGKVTIVGRYPVARTPHTNATRMHSSTVASSVVVPRFRLLRCRRQLCALSGLGDLRVRCCCDETAYVLLMASLPCDSCRCLTTLSNRSDMNPSQANMCSVAVYTNTCSLRKRDFERMFAPAPGKHYTRGVHLFDTVGSGR